MELTPEVIGRRALLGRGLRLGLGVGVGAALGGGGGFLPAARPAAAGEDMCAGDPIIEIEGTRFSMVVLVPRRVLPQITPANPVLIRIYLPKGVTGTVVAYIGPVPERVEFISTNEVDDPYDAELTVRYQYWVPHASASQRYKYETIVTGSLETRRFENWSGEWKADQIKIYRRPQPKR